jgi:hypothetical protein
VVGQPSVIGFMAVPLLFASLPSKALAGYAAAHLFAAQTCVAGLRSGAAAL